MQVATLFGWIVVASALGQTNAQNAIDEQDKVFHDWWGIRLERKFNELPVAGSVPEFRTPYSGCIYLDSAGGTVRALRKYDQAFNGGRNSATRHEQWDTTAFRKTEYVQRTYRYGLFGGRVGRRTVAVTRIPHWHGHCNGWTSAAIRYAEPQKTVVRNGVSFSPADIKGLLAEIYMYQDEDILAGESSLVSAGTFHLLVANWLGRSSHPLAMEASPGREKWNYPIYKFRSTAAPRGRDRVEVSTWVTYAHYSRSELDQSPRIAREKYFHYYLALDEQGHVVGGEHYRDSSRIDMLWLPKPPVVAGQEGNQRGNPHVDVNQVVALWRESVPDEICQRWHNYESRQRGNTAVTASNQSDRTIRPASAEAPVRDASSNADQPAPPAPQDPDHR